MPYPLKFNEFRCTLILCSLADACRLFGSSETLVPLASSYLKWISIGSPLMILHMMGAFLIRLDGNPGYAMATSIVGTVLNIFLCIKGKSRLSYNHQPQ